jgi:hypothetical protein
MAKQFQDRTRPAGRDLLCCAPAINGIGRPAGILTARAAATIVSAFPTDVMDVSALSQGLVRPIGKQAFPGRTLSNNETQCGAPDLRFRRLKPDMPSTYNNVIK